MSGGPRTVTAALAAVLLVWGCGSDPTNPGGGGDTNHPPVASAGPDLAASVGLTLSVDGGASSDPDGDPITYAWTLTPPAGSSASLDDATSETPSFTPDVEGAYTLSLKVSDGEAESPTDAATVTATDNTVTSAIVAASGGSVTSSDGALSMTVPAGALAADTDISVTLVAPAQLPAALTGLPGDVTAYDLGPDGTTFSAPVEVGFDVPAAVTTSSGSASLSGALLYSESGGTVESMADVLMAQDDADPTAAAITGHLSHFSHAVFVASSMEFRIDAPAEVEAGVPFDVTYTVDITGAGLNGVGSASVEDDSTGDVSPDQGFTPSLSGTSTVVSVTNSYTCSAIGDSRIRAFMQFEATDDFGSVVRIQLGKPVTCVQAALPLVTTLLPDLYRAQRLLPIPGSNEEITGGGLVRRINLATKSVTDFSQADADPPEWVFALSDANYLVYSTLGSVDWFVPNGDPLSDTMFVQAYDQPRHVTPVSENTVAVASAFGDLGFITYTPGGASGSFQDAFRNLESQTNPQQDPATNLQAIWVSSDAQTFVGAVTEGGGDAAVANTQAAILDANTGTGDLSVTLLPNIIDFIVDYDLRHQMDIDCGALEGGLPTELLCVFTSGFESPLGTSATYVEGDGYVVIFTVDTFSKTAEFLDWTYGNAYVGANVFPYDGTTTAVAVANQFTGDIDLWHVQGSDVTSFSVSLDDQCEAPTDLVLVGFGARGALSCQAASPSAHSVLVIENLDLQRPPAP